MNEYVVTYTRCDSLFGPVVAHGAVEVTARDEDGAMDWVRGTTPFVRIVSVGQRCNCEHEAHEDAPCKGRPEGKRAEYVGVICDGCAAGHLKDYVLP